jgi:hypothetical protein
MQRRTWLKVSAGAAALLTVAGVGLSVVTRPGWVQGRLSASARDVMAAIARAVLDGSLPVEALAQRTVLDAHLQRLEAAIAAFPHSVQGEIGELLMILGSTPGRLGLARLTSDWPEAKVSDVQAMLQRMRTSSLSLERQAYHALRDLTHGAYYADASTWGQLGYPGPPPLG